MRIANKMLLKPFIYAKYKKSPYPTSQLHTDQTNNKLYLYEKTNTTNIDKQRNTNLSILL